MCQSKAFEDIVTNNLPLPPGMPVEIIVSPSPIASRESLFEQG